MEKIKYAFIGNYHTINSGSQPVSYGYYDYLLNDGNIPLIASTKKNKILRIWQYLKVLFGNYDIIFIDVFSGGPYFIALLSVIIAKLRNKKSISTFHGGGLPIFLKKYKLINTISLFDKLITPSKYLISQLKPYQKQFVYLENPIKIETFPFKEKKIPQKINKLNFIWIRAFDYVYCPEIPIKTMAILKNKGYKVSLKMIGPDLGLKKHCEKLIKNLDLESEVKIIGPIANNKLIRFFNNATIFLSTSNLESFGVSIVEAALSGTAVIAYATGEIPLFWNQEEIMIVDTNHEVNFFNAIEKLIYLDDFCKRVKLARKKAENLEMKLILEKWKIIIK